MTSITKVRIRMYRQGIGDSFLLTFFTGEQAAHVLIDCGVLVGTPNGAQWAKNICADVATTTNGHVHAIVGTHAHWDHVSGFWDAQEQFGKLKVGEVWLPWAENPKDGRAAKHKQAIRRGLQAVQQARAQLAASGSPQARERARAIEQVLAFHGPDALGAAAGGRTDAALGLLRELVRKPNYWEPGDLIERAWLPGVRIYVLGPPRDEKFLGKMLGKKGSEMYGIDAGSGFCAALAGRARPDKTDVRAGSAADASCPFDTQWRWSEAQANDDPVLAPVLQRYKERSNTWRQIDDEWLNAAEQLSLQLDNVVNNLSLVLAFELVESGDVLLFVGDAQIGNWLSWKSLSWPASRKAAKRSQVNSADLLARTVFYKVGHHGSHNATLMNGGLEAMVHPDLVAAIPVNQSFANDVKKWDMPAQTLYPHILEKTAGRVLRSDGSGPTSSDPDQQPEKSARSGFRKAVSIAPGVPPLYVDFLIPTA